jgi:hypothetical protein
MFGPCPAFFTALLCSFTFSRPNQQTDGVEAMIGRTGENTCADLQRNWRTTLCCRPKMWAPKEQ